MDDRLYRSPNERVIAGVAGGMATWLNLDPSLVRVAWVLLGIVSGGLFVLVYIVMMIIVPLPPPGWVPRPRGAAAGPGWPTGAGGSGAGGSGAIPGWQAAEGTTWGPPPGAPPAAESGTPAPAPAWSTPPPAWVPPRVDAGNAAIVFGAVLVLLGSWFLVDRYVNIDWQLVWPVLVIVLGVVVILGALRPRRRSDG